MNKTFHTILNDESNVLSLICVLVHLEEPNAMIQVFKKSNLKYIFFSIPIFSLSVFIENAFKKCSS